MPSPSLRLVQDRLINADGSGTSGALEVSWAPGQSSDGFTIAGGKLTVRLDDGQFGISLAPGGYRVKYISMHGAQRSEKWIVPSTAGPFRISQVRQ